MKINIFVGKIFEIIPHILLRVKKNKRNKIELNLKLGWLYYLCQTSVVEWNYKCKIN